MEIVSKVIMDFVVLRVFILNKGLVFFEGQKLFIWIV